MSKAPLISTIIAVALIPVAYLFIHSFIAANKKWKSHSIMGLFAIVGDLGLSLTYMLYRTFGGNMNGSSLNLIGNNRIYFASHGMVALVVIILELSVLVSGIYKAKKKSTNNLHGRLGRILFYIWWLAFLSGEFFYIIHYMI